MRLSDVRRTKNEDALFRSFDPPCPQRSCHTSLQPVVRGLAYCYDSLSVTPVSHSVSPPSDLRKTRMLKLSLSPTAAVMAAPVR